MPLFAQQRAFVFANINILEVETSGPAFGRVIRLIPWSSSGAPQKLIPIAAGAFIAWPGGEGVQVIDVHSGSRQGYAIPGFFVQEILGTDETTFRVLLLGTFPPAELPPFPTPITLREVVLVADLRTGSTQAIDIGKQESIAGVAYAARPNLLFVARRQEPLSQIDVISADTGEIVKSLTVPPVSGGFLQSVTSEGTRLFLQGYEGLTVVDTVTGGLVGSIPASTRSFGLPVIDEGRNRLLVTGITGAQSYLAAFSLDSMQPLGRIELSPLGIQATHLFDVSPQSATMLALYSTPSARSDGSPLALVGLNVDTGQLRATADLPGLGTQIYDVDVALVRLTEPSAPRNFAANVTGSRVELGWAPAGALRYEVEAGSAPGLTNLTTISVTDTHLTVDGVPSGVYYLRVRAVNTIGTSAPSQEIRLVVP